MQAQSQFGRRGVSRIAPAAPATPQVMSSEPEPATLSPEAEAFRSGLAGEWRRSSPFARWRRGRQVKFFLAWGVRVALMSPSLLCLALHVPLSYAGGLGVAGLAANGWLRRERARDRAEIRAWGADS